MNYVTSCNDIKVVKEMMVHVLISEIDGYNHAEPMECRTYTDYLLFLARICLRINQYVAIDRVKFTCPMILNLMRLEKYDVKVGGTFPMNEHATVRARTYDTYVTRTRVCQTSL